MAFSVDTTSNIALDDYGAVAHLAAPVQQLQMEAEPVVPKLKNRRLWMVNSTARGGGVAEMLPTMVALLRELGVETEWVVIESDQAPFFDLTKRVHNLIHGGGNPELVPEHRDLFDRVNRENAAYLRERIAPGDILIVHDPQPMPLASILKEDATVTAVWRCHIGLDSETPQTRAAWDFLRPYADAYDHAVFSAPEYTPEFFAGRSTIIYPGINPLTPKNLDLGLHKVVGILANSGLATAPGPLVTPPYAKLAQRLHADGGYYPANSLEDIGLLSRPIVTQVSRWDRLKGFEPLLRAFARLKTDVMSRSGDRDLRHRRRQDLVRLVLAGPDPDSIADDPEGIEVLDELRSAYLALDPQVQEAVAVVTLPMKSPAENALMVNALQRASTIVVQNSLREGFGLTIAEAMWKRVPILSNSQACGPRQQVRDRVDGRLIPDPTDVQGLADTLDTMLEDADGRALWGRNAQRHVHQRFLIFSQLCDWIRLLNRLL